MNNLDQTSLDGRMDVPPGSIDGDRSGRVALTVPADLGSIRVIGAVVRGWAASVGLGLDEIENLWLAVDEAFSALVAAPGPRFVSVEIVESSDDHQAGIDVAVKSDAHIDPWPSPDPQMALARRVLERLADEVSFVRTPVGTEIRMSTSPKLSSGPVA